MAIKVLEIMLDKDVHPSRKLYSIFNGNLEKVISITTNKKLLTKLIESLVNLQDFINKAINDTVDKTERRILKLTDDDMLKCMTKEELIAYIEKIKEEQD